MFLSKDGCRIFDQKGCKDIRRQVATAKYVNGVYELEVDSTQHDEQKCFVTENTHPDKNVHNSQELRHRRSAHLNAGDKFKQKNCSVCISRTRDTINCEPCQIGKITRTEKLWCMYFESQRHH
jgi:hypothetical protein